MSARPGRESFSMPSAGLARAAAAVGIDALFLEVHDDPARAPCDGGNMIDLAILHQVIEQVKVVEGLGRERK